jgi:hypothetical protein
MTSPRCDPQQDRAYAWEGDFTDWAPHRATKAEMRKIVRKLCRMYGVPVPEIVFLTKNFHKGKSGTSTYDPDLHRIKFRPRHMQPNTAAHEAAHTVTDWILGPSLPAHGREWMGVMINCLVACKVAPRAALEAHARSRRLQFCRPGDVAPSRIRRRYAARTRDVRRTRRLLQVYSKCSGN